MKKLVKVGSVELCVETFGAAAAPPVLLIHGAAASMDFWEDAFCERLAAGPRFVIRYDHRDTGQSTQYPAGEPSYTGTDLSEDALGILDALGIAKAHIVGVSMGGGFAQRLVVEHPERVASVTFISTSPGDPELPPMSDKLQAAFSAEAEPTDWSNSETALDSLIELDRLFAGTYPYDEPGRRAIYAQMMARTPDMAAAMTNHWMIDGGESIRHRLAEIAVPALVLHGTDDPLLPLGHGEALAQAIPTARLVPLPGAGHDLPEQVWDLAITEILQLTTAS
ncbi:alpha/beta fold hydrolase [Kribbella deserti]|uniref:Alpha/beta fold hydrolase n=1 Tax=Kribbella deserti TaxID=1926257 RepID=A0ABV6QK38_9ACTN